MVYYDWSGAYIGFNAGGVWNEVNRTFPVGGARSIPNHGTRLTAMASSASMPARSGSGAPGFWVRSGPQRVLQGVSEQHGHPSGPRLRHLTFLPAQDHQPVHGRSAAWLCLGSIDDLRDRRLGFGQSQGSVLLDSHRPLRRSRHLPTAQSRNDGWYAGGGFDYMVHKGPLVDVIFGLEYQHYDVGAKKAFCVNRELQSDRDGTMI